VGADTVAMSHYSKGFNPSYMQFVSNVNLF
jgi:hypothetical protein